MTEQRERMADWRTNAAGDELPLIRGDERSSANSSIGASGASEHDTSRTDDDAARADAVLGESDRRAVDAWMEGNASQHQDDARVAKVEALMGLLGQDGRKPSSLLASVTASPLVDLAYARVLRAAQAPSESLERDDARLCEEDEDAMTALVMAGFDPARVTSSLRQRAQRALDVGSLAAHADAPLAGGQLLIERTYQRVLTIAETRTNQSSATLTNASQRLGLEPLPLKRSSLAWADVVSVAAVLLIGVSVAWPVVSTYRTHARRTACMGNLAQVASAMGQYGNDFQGSMPMASASLGGLWWNVGKDVSQSNSANLFTLARTRYTGIEQLACDGNSLCSKEVAPDAVDWPDLPNVSYSYFVMFGRARPAFGDGAQALSPAVASARVLRHEGGTREHDGTRQPASLRRAGTISQEGFISPASTVILSDASPVIRRAVRGQRVFPRENSANHGGQGQNVLRADASAMWLHTPVHGGDNIWLPANVEEALRDVQGQIAQGQQQGEVALLSRQDAAQRRAVRLQGTETPTSASDSFVGP